MGVAQTNLILVAVVLVLGAAVVLTNMQDSSTHTPARQALNRRGGHGRYTVREEVEDDDEADHTEDVSIKWVKSSEGGGDDDDDGNNGDDEGQDNAPKRRKTARRRRVKQSKDASADTLVETTADAPQRKEAETPPLNVGDAVVSKSKSKSQLSSNEEPTTAQYDDQNQKAAADLSGSVKLSPNKFPREHIFRDKASLCQLGESKYKTRCVVGSPPDGQFATLADALADASCQENAIVDLTKAGSGAKHALDGTVKAKNVVLYGGEDVPIAEQPVVVGAVVPDGMLRLCNVVVQAKTSPVAVDLQLKHVYSNEYNPKGSSGVRNHMYYEVKATLTNLPDSGSNVLLAFEPFQTGMSKDAQGTCSLENDENRPKYKKRAYKQPKVVWTSSKGTASNSMVYTKVSEQMDWMDCTGPRGQSLLWDQDPMGNVRMRGWLLVLVRKKAVGDPIVFHQQVPFHVILAVDGNTEHAFKNTVGSVLVLKQPRPQSYLDAKVKLPLRWRKPVNDYQAVEEVIEEVEIPLGDIYFTIIDMWDRHWCDYLSKRAGNMCGPINDLLNKHVRGKIQILHQATEVVKFYQEDEGRDRVGFAPIWDLNFEAKKLTKPDWYKKLKKGILKGSNGRCKSGQSAGNFSGEKRPWYRQCSTIEIKSPDAIGDAKQELYNWVRQRGYKWALLTGVHTNLCIINRGIKFMKTWGIKAIVVRDMTDAVHAPKAGEDPAEGTQNVVKMIETLHGYSITSTELAAALEKVVL